MSTRNRQVTATLPAFPRSLTRVVVFCIVALPAVILPGEDAFRIPKEIFVRAEAIVIIALLSIHVIWRGLRPIELSPAALRALQITAAVLGWSVLTAAFASNRYLAIKTLIYVISLIVVFVATLLIVPQLQHRSLYLFSIPALVSGIIYVLQEHDVWRFFPYREDVERHLQSTGLTGNPDDLGGYLIAPALAMVALAIHSRAHRKLAGAFGVALAALIVASQSLTALLAYGAGIAVLGLIAVRRRLLFVGVALAFLTVTIVVYAPVRQKISTKLEHIRAGSYEDFSAYRMIPFLAAIKMAKAHPVFGVGPGCFQWEFFFDKLTVLEEHPKLLVSNGAETNYAEVHNDHLQVAAVTGLPGYALFLLSLVTLAAISVRKNLSASDERASVARLLAAPLSVSFGVLALAQFPLELASVMHPTLAIVALCVAWSDL